ncbi:MAG: endolytic transglycosylase MltG [Caldilineaceae bacterium]|nr:endolytic transglycosylase MltG [Caldilineaceae bacterium]
MQLLRRWPPGPTAIRCFLLIAVLLAASACTREGMLQSYLDSNEEALQQPHSVDERPIRFEVVPGSTARSIAEQLASAGLIGDATLFEAYVRVRGMAQRLEAGTFFLNPAMTPVEIAEALQNSQAASIRVTIPEGWRLEQIADYLAENELLTDSEEYRRRILTGDLTGLDVSRYPFLNTRPAGASLEGYLFPSTFQLPAEGATATDFLTRQLDAFRAQVMPIYERAVANGDTALDLYATLTLASIVEREAVLPEERPAIAAVYLNRLAAGIKLDADPTVQYAMGYQPASGQWWKTPVFLEEYSSVDSPYNTYIYGGIPPGPIAGPGLASIRAVLHPDEHNYFYFVATPDGSGAHVFAETYEEQLENVRRYQGR